MFHLRSSQRRGTDVQWRYTLFAILLTLELTLILSPTAPSHLSPLFPQLSRYLPLPRSWINTPQFIWISRLHQIWTSLSVAIAQLAGVWQDPVPIGDELAKRAHALVRSIEAEGAYLPSLDTVTVCPRLTRSRQWIPWRGRTRPVQDERPPRSAGDAAGAYRTA